MDKLYIVSVELGKLLKEKGFDEWCLFQYVDRYNVKDSIIEKHGGLSDDGYLDLLKDYGGEYERDEVFENRIEIKQVHNKNSIRIFFDKQICSAPHIFDAKKWIEDKYNVYFDIRYNFTIKKWYGKILSSLDEDITAELKNLEKDIDEIYIYNNEMEAIEKVCIDYLNKIKNKNE
jgi:hypothetical protein